MKLTDINYIEFVYKSGYKPVIKYNGWDSLMELLKHKKGRKPIGFRCYTIDGIYMLFLEPNYFSLLRDEVK